MGVNIKVTVDPVSIFRDLLVSMRFNRMHMTYKVKTGYFISTWNAFVTGKTYTKIPWIPAKDEIPKLIIPEEKK